MANGAAIGPTGRVSVIIPKLVPEVSMVCEKVSPPIGQVNAFSVAVCAHADAPAARSKRASSWVFMGFLWLGLR